MSKTLISSQTITSAAASISISNIPSTYRDIVVELSFGLRYTADSSATVSFQFNGDTNNNYSMNDMYGSGTVAGAYRATSVNNVPIYVTCSSGTADTYWQSMFVNINAYSNTNVYKSPLARVNSYNGNGTGTRTTIGLWRSYNAISSILITQNATSFYPNTVVQVWGIS